MVTEKGKTLAKWVPSTKYQEEYDRIFKKRDAIYECPECRSFETTSEVTHHGVNWVDNDHNCLVCNKGKVVVHARADDPTIGDWTCEHCDTSVSCRIQEYVETGKPLLMLPSIGYACSSCGHKWVIWNKLLIKLR